MIKYNKIIIALIIVFWVSIFSIRGFSQQNLLFYKGGVESIIYKGDTVILENTVLDDCKAINTAKCLKVAYSQLHSEFIKILYFPISYSMSNKCELNFSLPLLTKSMMDNSDNIYLKTGYGDTKLGFLFYYNIVNTTKTITRISITLPTGDEVASDNGLIIPMGNGGYSYSILQSCSKDFKFIPFRFFINAGAVYYTETKAASFQISNGYVFSSLFGVEFIFNSDLFFQCKINYIHIPDRQHKVYSSDWEDKNESLKGSDLISVVRYKILDDITLNLISMIPLYEKQDEDIPEPHRRKWKVFFNLEKKFVNKDKVATNFRKKSKGLYKTRKDRSRRLQKRD